MLMYMKSLKDRLNILKILKDKYPLTPPNTEVGQHSVKEDIEMEQTGELVIPHFSLETGTPTMKELKKINKVISLSDTEIISKTQTPHISPTISLPPSEFFEDIETLQNKNKLLFIEKEKLEEENYILQDIITEKNKKIEEYEKNKKDVKMYKKLSLIGTGIVILGTVIKYVSVKKEN